MAIFFYLFAGLMLLSSLLVITSRNPVYSVLWLIFTFCNGSGLLVLIGAEFLAMMLIIIYVGAVAVLFLFVVMMLDIKVSEFKSRIGRESLIAFFIALLLFADLGLVIMLGTKIIVPPSVHSHVRQVQEDQNHSHPEFISGSEKKVLKQVQDDRGGERDDQGTVQDDKLSIGNSYAIGRLLYTTYILPFQTAGLILFVAMIATISLTIRLRPGVKRQKVWKQMSRNKENSLSVVSVNYKEGVQGLKYDD